MSGLHRSLLPILNPCYFVSCCCLLLAGRLAVFHRLYQQAVALRQKMEMRRDNVIRDELDSLAQHKTNMSWISSEMMRDRSAGPFGNYGEMLYAESLESLARKRDRVSVSPHGAQGVGWRPGACRSSGSVCVRSPCMGAYSGRARLVRRSSRTSQQPPYIADLLGCALWLDKLQWHTACCSRGCWGGQQIRVGCCSRSTSCSTTLPAGKVDVERGGGQVTRGAIAWRRWAP